MARFFIGLLLLTLGAAFLLSNAGFLDIEFNVWKLISTYWPSLLIIWGVKELIFASSRLFTGNRRLRGSLFFGTLLTTAGVILQGNKLDLFYIGFSDIWKYLWPVLIIYIGFSIIFNRNESRGKRRRAERKTVVRWDDSYTETTEIHSLPSTSNVPKKMLVGDLSLGRGVWNLEDTTIRMGVGNIHLDLTKAIIPEGETVLELSSWVGDIKVVLPEDLAVMVEAEARIGDIDVLGENYIGTGTGRIVTYKSEDYDLALKKVYIIATLSIGGVTIKRAF